MKHLRLSQQLDRRPLPLQCMGYLLALVLSGAAHGSNALPTVQRCEINFEKLAHGAEWTHQTEISEGIHRVDALAGGLLIPPKATLVGVHWLIGTGYAGWNEQIRLALENHRPEDLPYCAIHERMHQITAFNLSREQAPVIQEFQSELRDLSELEDQRQELKKAKKLTRAKDEKIKWLAKKLSDPRFIGESLEELISNTATVLASGNPRIEIEITSTSFAFDKDEKKKDDIYRDYSHPWELEGFNQQALSKPRFSSDSPVGYNDPYRMFGPVKYFLWTRYMRPMPNEARRSQILEAVYRGSAKVLAIELLNLKNHPGEFQIDPERMNRRLMEHLEVVLAE